MSTGSTSTTRSARSRRISGGDRLNSSDGRSFRGCGSCSRRTLANTMRRPPPRHPEISRARSAPPMRRRRARGSAVTPLSAAVSAGRDERRIGPAAPAAPADTAASERVGIVGAGKLGMALARAAVAAGYEVAVASSGPAKRIALSVDVLAPGAAAATIEEVLDFADVIVLAVPTHRFRQLPSDLFDGKIVVDAMNYWPDTDGEDPELAQADGGSSVVVQTHFPAARVVKSLNQLGYH